MKQITFMWGSRKTYEIPATRIITIKPAKVLMSSIQSTPNAVELDMEITDVGTSWS